MITTCNTAGVNPAPIQPVSSMVEHSTDNRATEDRNLYRLPIPITWSGLLIDRKSRSCYNTFLNKESPNGQWQGTQTNGGETLRWSNWLLTSKTGIVPLHPYHIKTHSKANRIRPMFSNSISFVGVSRCNSCRVCFYMVSSKRWEWNRTASHSLCHLPGCAKSQEQAWPPEGSDTI